jgi:hypothetical protein
MTKTRFLPTLLWIAVLLAACAPAASQPAGEPGPTFQAGTPTPSLSAQATIGSPALVPSPFPVATSRGPGLHATDPTTISLASGGLQLVEFFRFT